MACEAMNRKATRFARDLISFLLIHRTNGSFMERRALFNVLKVDGSPTLPMKKNSNILFIGLFLLAACSAADQSAATSVAATAFPKPTEVEVRALPTPSSPGDSVTW